LRSPAARRRIEQLLVHSVGQHAEQPLGVRNGRPQLLRLGWFGLSPDDHVMRRAESPHRISDDLARYIDKRHVTILAKRSATMQAELRRPDRFSTPDGPC
jgi:hypothetical protein